MRGGENLAYTRLRYQKKKQADCEKNQDYGRKEPQHGRRDKRVFSKGKKKTLNGAEGAAVTSLESVQVQRENRYSRGYLKKRGGGLQRAKRKEWFVF